MTIPISPGQIAYEGYWRASFYTRPPLSWTHLQPEWQRQWEAAAQAVLAMEKEEETL